MQFSQPIAKCYQKNRVPHNNYLFFVLIIIITWPLSVVGEGDVDAVVARLLVHARVRLRTLRGTLEAVTGAPPVPRGPHLAHARMLRHWGVTAHGHGSMGSGDGFLLPKEVPR